MPIARTILERYLRQSEFTSSKHIPVIAPLDPRFMARKLKAPGESRDFHIESSSPLVSEAFDPAPPIDHDQAKIGGEYT
jgi:hypothetical protein